MSIFESLEGVDATLFKVGRLTKVVEESSDEKDFQNTPLNDIVEAETTQEFLNKDILSDEDLDQLSDWEDFHQNTSSGSYERERIDTNDVSQSKSHLHRRSRASAAASTTAHAKQKLIQILQGDISILCQRWGLDKIPTVLVIFRKNPKLCMAY